MSIKIENKHFYEFYMNFNWCYKDRRNKNCYVTNILNKQENILKIPGTFIQHVKYTTEQQCYK